MATTVGDLKLWFDAGLDEGARYMIIVCDTFDHDDYPIYVRLDDDFYEKYDGHDGKNMQRIMEVYDLKKSWESQQAGRVMNRPPRKKKTGP